MRCGLDCVSYVCDLRQIPKKEIIKQLESRLCQQGISIYDIVTTLQKNGVVANGYRSFFLPKEKNTILYLKMRKTGHFIVLKEKFLYYANIHDPKMGDCKIAKWRLHFLYSHRYILCYNN